MRHSIILLPLLCLAAPVAAQQPDDLNRVIDEGLNHSQVMQIAQHLTDDIGGRMTNSPQMRQAEAWTADQFRQWGLSNVRKQGFRFGRGWWIAGSSVKMISPRPIQLTAIPIAWTPPTNGVLSAPIIVAPMKKERDFDAWRGKLAGKIVLLDEARAYKPADKPDFRRHTEEDLGELQTFPVPQDRDPDAQNKRLDEYRKRQELVRALNTFFAEEGVLATLSISSWDNGIIRATGGGARKTGEPVGVTELVLPAEHYNPLVRAVQGKQPVRLRINGQGRLAGRLPARRGE